MWVLLPRARMRLVRAGLAAGSGAHLMRVPKVPQHGNGRPPRKIPRVQPLLEGLVKSLQY